MEKQQRIELLGLSLFAIGTCGIILFFYMAFKLFTDFPTVGGITATDSGQIMTDFIAYLIQLTSPILILLVVGGVSLLIAQYGINTYSRETQKKP